MNAAHGVSPAAIIAGLGMAGTWTHGQIMSLDARQAVSRTAGLGGWAR